MIGKKGFTLVEVLVAISIVGIVGTILVAIFSNTLKGSNKSQILASIKQNGQSLLETIDKTIRSSDNVVCPTVTSPATISSLDTLVVVKNGTYTRYRIAPPTNHTVPSSCWDKNGCIVVDNPTPGPSEATPTPFINRVCNSSDPMSQAQILTDTNPQAGTLVVSGAFTRNRASGFKDQVTIAFTLQPGKDAPAAIRGQIDDTVFSTTIQLR